MLPMVSTRIGTQETGLSAFFFFFAVDTSAYSHAELKLIYALV